MIWIRWSAVTQAGRGGISLMNKNVSYLLAATALICTGPAVEAADLAGPYRAPTVIPAVGEASMSGWYLRGDAGFDVGPSIQSRFSEVGLDKRDVHDRTAGTAFYGLGIGYQFNDYLRGDVTADYYSTRRYRSQVHYVGDSGNTANVADYDADLTSAVFLANAYVDLGHYSGFTPYVGAGLGAAYHRLGTINELTTWTPLTAAGSSGMNYGRMSGTSDWNFAWALHAGVSYDLAKNLKLDFGYSYKDLGDIKRSGSVNCYYPACSSEKLEIKRFAVNDLHLGVRWMIDSTPVATPVYKPVVAKY
jgi:opacity protein-like surface antigen